jgi:hypothetical protein
VLLELFYRRAGYYVDHLDRSIGFALVGWLLAYLPIALRHVYGGSRWLTGVKLVGLGLTYLAVFWAGFMIVLLIGVSTV